MKYYVRRFIAGIITAPVGCVLYGLIYVALAGVGATPTGSISDNLIPVAIAWVIWFTFSNKIQGE